MYIYDSKITLSQMHFYFFHACLYVAYIGVTYFLTLKISFHKLTVHLLVSPNSLAH